MKKLLSILIIYLFSLPLTAKDGVHVDISVKALKSFSNSSGAYAGIYNNVIIAGGGSNSSYFNYIQNKKYFRDIYLRYVDTIYMTPWVKIGEFPTARAYGASVSTPYGVVCMGGKDEKGDLSQTLLLRYDHHSKQLNIDTIAEIPIPLESFAATYYNDEITITGGVSNSTPSLRAFVLNLKRHNSKWREIAPIKEPRVMAVMATQNSAIRPTTYIFGGYVPYSSSRQPKVLTNGEYYDPTVNKWFYTDDIIINGTNNALVNATATPFGGNFILFFGGVNKYRFAQILDVLYKHDIAKEGSIEKEEYREQLYDYLSEEEDYYQFNTNIIGYNTITNRYTYEGHNQHFGRAGATSAKKGNDIYIFGGNTQRGVISNDMVVVTPKTYTEFGIINWIVVSIYLLALLYVGFYFMKQDAENLEFFNGGGKIPWWAAGMSIFATMLSAITFMAIPAKVYATDWQYFPLAITILVITLPIIRYYLPFFRSLQTASAYQYLELRFNYLTRFIASSLFIVFMVARMALVLYLPSLALSTVIGINIYMCIAMLGVVTMIYSAMGGIKAVIWSDVIQGFLLLGGAILALGFLIFNTEDGLSGFIDTATQFDKFKMIDWNVDFTRTSLLVVVIGGLSMNLISYSSDQTVIQRYMTTDSTASARKSILFNGILSVIISVVFYLIGTALFTFYKTNPQSATYTLTNSDAIFPFYIISQLPTGIAGIIIAAIFAASMSTISSNINSISTAFTIDIFSRYAKNNTKEKSLITARIASVVAGVAGILLALSMASWNIISLFDYFSTILGLFASGLGGLFLLGIFYGSVGAKGALTGFILSTISVIVISQLTNISFLLYGAIGLLLSIMIGLITSWMLKEEHSKIGLTWNEFKKAKREGKLS